MNESHGDPTGIASSRSATADRPLPRPHRRQFVVGPEPFRAQDDWSCAPLSDGVWLSHCPELRTQLVSDLDGTRWALLGLVVENDPGEPPPADAIAKTRTAEIASIQYGWTGRWLLVGNGTLHLDASALLGCYHTEREGRRWASSSPALIATIAGRDPSEADPRALRYERGIAWVPLPRSRFPGISRLLPSQQLDLRSGVTARHPLPSFEMGRLGYDERIARVERAMRTTLVRLAEWGEPVWLGLSGGHDSRTVLALCQSAGLDVRTFTRIAPRMSVADQVLPPQLARRCGRPHVTLEGGGVSAEREKLARAHTAGHLSPGDALPYLRGERAELRGIAIGGHAFELFDGDYESLEAIPEVGEPDETARRIAEALGEPAGTSATAALADWLRWVAEHPLPDIDWRDRFYLEQDNAGWLAGKEQLYDLDDVMRFPVANAGNLWAMLLGFSQQEVIDAAIQKDLITHAAPYLLDWPFNPLDRHFGLRTLVSTKSWGLPAYGYLRATRAVQRRWRSWASALTPSR